MNKKEFSNKVSRRLAISALSEKILKDYEKLQDPAHGRFHIEAVRRHARDLAKYTKYNRKNILDIAAVLHDIGNLRDRKPIIL